MKNISYIILTIFVQLGIFTHINGEILINLNNAYIAKLDKPSNFPNFKFYNLEEENIILDEVLDKPTLMVFWASWCPYCKEFIKGIDRIHNKYIQEFNIIPIACENSIDNINKFYDLEDIQNLDIYIDKNLSYKSSLGFTLPSAFLLDKEGNVIAKFIGSEIDWDSKEINEILSKILKTQSD